MARVLSGKEDLAEFIRLVAVSIETEMGKDAVMAMTTGLNAATYPSALKITGAFDASNLITLGETVQAYNYGVRPIIAGTATALANVLPDSSMGYRMNVEGNGGSVDLIKDFYGFDLLRLPQYAAGSNPAAGLALSPNTLYVISPALDKLVKGSVSNTLSNSNQFYENADLTQNFTMRKDWDFAFCSAAYGGIYTING